MNALETVGILWVLLTSIAGHIVFAALVLVGAKAVIDYIRGLEEREQAHRPEVVRRATGG